MSKASESSPCMASSSCRSCSSASATERAVLDAVGAAFFLLDGGTVELGTAPLPVALLFLFGVRCGAAPPRADDADGATTSSGAMAGGGITVVLEDEDASELEAATLALALEED